MDDGLDGIGASAPLVPVPARRLEPTEPIDGCPGTVGDFWSWAFSDLRDNTLRGVFAEYLVGRALGAADGLRIGWADTDLTSRDGIEVEVKAAAYLQAWETAVPSKIVFSRLRARAWSPLAGYEAESSYRAQVYVFCLHTARRHARFDPLEVAQWEFWVASRSAVAATGCKSLGFAAVRRLARGPLAWAGLEEAVRSAAHGPGEPGS